MCVQREIEQVVAAHRHRVLAGLRLWGAAVQDLISMFNDNELELLISGLPDIDVEDLRANTEYQNYSPASPVIQYFWEVVRELDSEDLALLVQFVTGTSKVPLDGFKALQVGALCNFPPVLSQAKIPHCPPGNAFDDNRWYL